MAKRVETYHRRMRTIPDPGFAGDDGARSGDAERALAAYDADPDAGPPAGARRARRSRVLVPVVAMLGEVEYDEQGWRTTRPATWRPC